MPTINTQVPISSVVVDGVNVPLATISDIDIMKITDLTEIAVNGGTLATDEEYEVAYAQFQVLANKIMNGGANG